MTTDAVDVLRFLRPDGGWAITGNDYEGIEFINCEPLTEAEFKAGFAKYEAWKTEQDQAKAEAKAELLTKLGITAEEAALLLS